MKTTIKADLVSAMKQKDSVKMTALRSLLSKMSVSEKKDGKTLSDDDILLMIKSEIKQRNDSYNTFVENDRNDLAKKEKDEMLIFESYLPKQMTFEEIQFNVFKIITELSATSMKDMGKVMGKATKVMLGKADNAVISKIVKEKLSK